MHILEEQMLNSFKLSVNKLNWKSNFIINDIVLKTSNLLEDYNTLKWISSWIINNQFCLHVPQLSFEDIYLDSDLIYDNTTLEMSKVNYFSLENIIKKIIPKVNNINNSYNEKYDSSKLEFDYSNSKIKLINWKIFCESIKWKLEELYFSEIWQEEGKFIQNNLHYIQNFRNDSLIHVWISNSKWDILAYCSFSILDRDYPLSAMPVWVRKEDVLNMTRAFWINNSPKNLMSTLYNHAYKYIKLNYPEIKYIMTYINQNLLFQWSSFKGSSYIVKWTSPMEYLYVDWFYKNRKWVRENERPEYNKLLCLPIVLLLRWTNKGRQMIIENDNTIVDISKNEYSNW